MNKKFFKFHFPWLFLMIIIFVQSSIGSIKLPDLEFELEDKIVHFLVFGILGILMARGLRNSGNKTIKDHYLSITTLICILYGASDEIHQYFVPGRDSSYGDWIADILGILIMVWVYHLYVSHQNQKTKNRQRTGR
jgi:VanZ family protein